MEYTGTMGGVKRESQGVELSIPASYSLEIGDDESEFVADPAGHFSLPCSPHRPGLLREAVGR